MLSGAVLIAMAAFGCHHVSAAAPVSDSPVGLPETGTNRTERNQLPLRREDNIESLLKVEPLAVEVGLGLVRLVEGAQNSPLLRRIAGLPANGDRPRLHGAARSRRRQFAAQGIGYVVLLKGAESHDSS
jgi:flagellar biosynthesis component FlhA